MISVVIVGTGNVAQNLFYALDKTSNVEVKQIVGRNENHFSFTKGKVPTTTDYTKIDNADIYILAITDDSIGIVAQKIKHIKGIIVHTSGATSITALSGHKQPGIFYPLQTFTKGKIISFAEIPICIEAKTSVDLKLLRELGNTLSNTVIAIDSDQRKKIHVAAVFVNNFTNYMYTIGKEICEENNLDFKLLHPLIKETAAKLEDLTPIEAQTGPAKRNDQKTLHNHLNLIKNNHQRELYTLLSNAIKEKHGKEL
ncbi:Rossmann-like and DUF2520 domain-containing protein [Maribacter hydrothermalis]|uniref:DUF2520 domain-containing protein n=1 Tax=Maribacter hydrothermalis TaxID=1836467 RepID=A0A1B7Z8Y0_9FLAO|nr:Rossmann-like and DUF2520 domain-containing protein [Maribacter hydrothermalis]APQ18841.1 hypothetical protein BTR34_16620 [Maribacter hydrothermalis]OBR39146.1 hypothetical protein A9200_05655 [Maribacter hydrothermalis]